MRLPGVPPPRTATRDDPAGPSAVESISPLALAVADSGHGMS